MDVIHFPEDARPSRWSQPVLALGNFDGVHRGHRKILERVRRVADERGATSVVMTFDPHPPRVVRPDKAPPLLMTKAQRLESLTAFVEFVDGFARQNGYTGARNVPGFENLTNLDQLPLRGALVIALPMKIEGGSGGPLRAIALVPR